MGCKTSTTHRLRNESGQMALLMILLFAVALIFFAVSLNWGRIAQIKTQSLIGANSGAMAAGSVLASDAQSKWMQNIGGSTEDGWPGKCESTSIWTAIVGLILAIVAVILTWGGAIYLVVLAITALVMSVANLALQVFVIQPGLTSLWNKLQRNLQPDAYFLEQGITSGITAVGTDTALIPDLFDMDTDGKFYGAGGASGKDEVGRYGFFYTERLKMLQPPALDNVSQFVSKLRVFTNGDPSRSMDCSLAENLFSACCLSGSQHPAYGCEWIMSDVPCSDPNDARCNSCCVPEYQAINNPYRNNFAECKRRGIDDCSSPVIYQRIRSLSCAVGAPLKVPIKGGYNNNAPITAIPAECSNIATNPYASTAGGPVYPYVYDPYYQDYPNTADFSFMKLIGQDAVRGGTARARVDYGIPEENPAQYMYAFDVPAGSPPIIRGDVFSMLWNMKGKLAVNPQNNTIAAIGKVLDRVTPLTNFYIDKGANECPPTDFYSETYAGTGAVKWWKPTMDALCHAEGQAPKWPYTNNCDDVRFEKDADGKPVKQICSQWHEDALDTLVLDGKAFMKFAEDITGMDRKTAEKNFTTWYPNAAQWIAPECDASAACANQPDKIACNIDVCSKGQEGTLRKWRRIIGGKDGEKGLYKVFKDWVATTPANANDAFCPAQATPDLSTDELTLYTTPSSDGNPPSYNERAARCLNYYKNADVKFQRCLTEKTPISCSNLPRSLVNGFSPNNHDGLTEASFSDLNSGYMQQIKASYDLALANKTQISNRAAIVSDVVFKAVKVRDEFKKSYLALDAFLGGQGECDIFSANSASCANSPAYILMKARRDYSTAGGDINNFIIYGWKGPRTAKIANAVQGNNEKQYWHMVRVEVKIPQRCPGDSKLCGPDHIPSIETETKGFLGTTRCYWLKNYDGRALVRVTRWDEDRSSSNAVQFMNKVKLWGFTTNVGGRKTPIENTVERLQELCAGNVTSDVAPLGMTKETWDTMRNLALTDSEKGKFRNAFMINLLKGQGEVKDSKGRVKNNDANKNANCVTINGVTDCLAREEACLALADDFLSRGISSTSCVRYYFDQKENRMAVKFEKCPPNAFKANVTDHIDVKKKP